MPEWDGVLPPVSCGERPIIDGVRTPVAYSIYAEVHMNRALNPLSPNVADLQHFDIEFFVASLFATLFSQELTLLQLV